MKAFRATCVAVAIMAVLGCLPATMQAQTGSTASISGVITDQVGNPLAGAFIAVRNEANQNTQRVTADAEGKFTVASLPLGTYSIEASAPNFAPRVREGVQLTAAGVSGISMALNVGNMSQSVTVEAEGSLAATLAPSQASLDTRTVKSTIQQSFVENFTAPTSDYTEVVMMAPGTFSVNPNGVGLGDGKVYFRGFSDGQYTMSFDGIPFEDTNSPTHHSWVFFPGMWIGSTDFDRSPGTASTIGPTNFGGSINMASRDPLAGMTFRGTASYGSFNTKLFDLSADSGLFGGNKHLFTADIHQLLSDGYQTLNRQKRDGGSMKYIYRINDRSQITVFTGIIDLWTNTPNTKGPTRAQVAAYGDNFLLANTNDTTSPFYPLNTAFNYYHVQTDFSYVGYHSDLGNGWLFDNKLYQYRYWNKQNYQNGNTVSTVSAVDKLNGYNKYGDTLTLSNASRFGIFRAGLWYEWAYTDRYQIPGDPRTHVNALEPNFHEHFITQSVQPYAEYEFRVTSKLSISGGIKWAYYDMGLTQYQDNGKTVGCLGGGLLDFVTGKAATASDPLAYCGPGSQAFTKHRGVYNNFLPSVDARYRLMRNVSVYTQFAMGSVIPPSNVFDVKNAAVLTTPTPTTVKTVQGGAVMKWNRVTLDVDAYYSRFQNPYTSYTDPVTSEAVYTLPAGGDSQTKGIEAESNIQVGHGFGLYLNATKGKANYVNSGLYVASAPKDTETIGVTYTNKNWDFGFFNKRIGEMYNDNGTINQAIPIDSFLITNVYANYTVKNSSLWRGTKFRLSVNNLQDSHAIVAISAGAAGTTAVPYTVNPADVLTLLAGRSVSFSMTFGFAPKK